MPLTRKQLALLKLLVDLSTEKGFPPTLRELQAAGGFASTRSVVQYLDVLEAAGFIERGPGSRNLRVLRTTEGDGATGVATAPVPILGTVAAGTPLLAEENITGYRQVATDLLRSGFRHFLLRVQGDSMDLAGIADGDLVLVRQQPSASNGERVVALIDDSATVKRLRLGREAIVLEPVSSNPNHAPIIVSQDFRVQGIVVATVPRASD